MPLQMRHVLILAATALGACAVPTDVEESGEWADRGRTCASDAPARSLPQPLRDALPEEGFPDMNSQWAAIARQVPGGWGGFFREHGKPTMYLVDPGQQAAAAEALQRLYPASAGARVLRGRWDFAQLHDWYRYLAGHVWQVQGVHMSDIDEVGNRILYGVLDEAARRRLEERLTALEIPCFLVAIEIREPASFR